MDKIVRWPGGLCALFIAAGCATQPPGGPHPATSHDSAHVTFLGHESLLVTHGGTGVLVDPFYFDWPDVFDVMPNDVKAKAFRGEAPFDGVQTVLVTHVHGDHFFSRDLLHWLDLHPQGRVILPRQGYDRLASEPSATTQTLARLVAVDAVDGEPSTFTYGGLRIEAPVVRHIDIGRPQEVMEHVAYRVTLNGRATFSHLGDADPSRAIYASQQAFWGARTSDVTFVPYWFFTEGDVDVLRDLNATHAVAIHLQSVRPEQVDGLNAPYFLRPMATCEIGLPADARPEQAAACGSR